MDFEFLAKLLMLTKSDADPEALSAIRKANEYLEKFNKSWTDVFSRNTGFISWPSSPNPTPSRSGRGVDPFDNQQEHEPGGQGTFHDPNSSTCNCFTCQMFKQAQAYAKKHKVKQK